MLKKTLFQVIKEIQFRSPLKRYFFPRYYFHFSVPQLCFFCECIHRTKDVSGAIVEIGCASGATTVFLNKYLDAQRINKKYFAMDTFDGFVAEDIEYEVSKRGKKRDLFLGFSANRQKWFDGTMKSNKIDRVISVKADVNKFPLDSLGDISFCLLDVDLYRPTKKALSELYAGLSMGGILVVDDCDPNNIRWDGSDQAYKEFMEEISKPIHIKFGKLGVIEKTD